MTTPPAAATIPLAPGPMPPPVAGAPTGVVLVLDADGLGVELGVLVEVGLGVLVAVAVAVPVAEPLGLAEAVHDGVAEGVGDAVPDAGVEVEVDGDAEVEVDADAEVEVDADADADVDTAALGVTVAVAVPQLDGTATATSLHELASAASVAAISRVTVPVARPICPAHCSFSQPLCRDRRKVFTVPQVVRLVSPRPGEPGERRGPWSSPRAVGRDGGTTPG